ncbi:protein phosphatase 1 regulatory subunit 3B isoform 1-T3 [Clarias gariepinus]|uniref:protein phosphatase 1 regulatory subunit 3B n=1 Tax=Clarias gariepinus TaxID=13013 RepID=UPI00234C68E5|nr:protein phosphatase 1 regulatory subunit 3B [Clarias gariepinus]XP_053334000.1 protein phosphatase 1 regulatory subunit 3B [Clarias gariepinus]XP_053334001.1 protein phosphatase 1 regulatory subunit 3B [Clarias gariepinus]
MPVELVMPLYLSSDDFQSRMSGKCKMPLRPCLHTSTVTQFGFHSPLPQSESRERAHGKVKKQVSFADHKGLALAVVKVFSEFDDPIDIPLSIQQLFVSALNVSEEDDKLVLGFSQPSADYLQFRQRLERDSVCLEHCVLKHRAIAGTIKVKNLSYQKAVKVRITFDAWKSHIDIECQYVNDAYLGSEWDTFSFEVNLPGRMLPHEHVEFAVCYMVEGNTYWDSNQGQNYKITHSALKKKSTSDMSNGDQHYSDWDAYFDGFGNPRCSNSIFTEWRSYTGYEDLGPYY